MAWCDEHGCSDRVCGEHKHLKATNSPYPDWIEGCLCFFDTVGSFDGYAPDCPHHAEAAMVCEVSGDGQHVPGLAPWEHGYGAACTKCGQVLKTESIAAPAAMESE